MEFLASLEDTAAPSCLNTVIKHTENQAANPAGLRAPGGPVMSATDWQ